MNKFIFFLLILFSSSIFQCSSGIGGNREPDSPQKKAEGHPDSKPAEGVLYNEKVDGYRGIWYMNQPLDNEYKFKYSGGLGTYCAKGPEKNKFPISGELFFRQTRREEEA